MARHNGEVRQIAKVKMSGSKKLQILTIVLLIANLVCTLKEYTFPFIKGLF